MVQDVWLLTASTGAAAHPTSLPSASTKAIVASVSQPAGVGATVAVSVNA